MLILNFSGSFLDLSNRPTTLAAYGITDSFDGSWNSLAKPTSNELVDIIGNAYLSNISLLNLADANTIALKS